MHTINEMHCIGCTQWTKDGLGRVLALKYSVLHYFVICVLYLALCIFCASYMFDSLHAVMAAYSGPKTDGGRRWPWDILPIILRCLRYFAHNGSGENWGRGSITTMQLSVNNQAWLESQKEKIEVKLFKQPGQMMFRLCGGTKYL